MSLPIFLEGVDFCYVEASWLTLKGFIYRDALETRSFLGMKPNMISFTTMVERFFSSLHTQPHRPRSSLKTWHTC